MTGAMILFGSSLFCLYALPRTGPASPTALLWPRPLLMASAVAVLSASVLGFLAQTAVLAGSMAEALQFDALNAAATGMSFGRSSIVRAATAALFLFAFAVRKPDRPTWWGAALAGALICASFAWMGHGAATPGVAGLLHVTSDICHTWAAGVWIGALVVFLILLMTDAGDSRQGLHIALQGFAGVGSGLVAVLVATGLINSWFVVGLAGLPKLLTTPYGQLLNLKLVLFAAMLGLAAANRFRLTPRLGQALAGATPAPGAIAALQKSLAWETGLSIAVLGLVAWFGTLAPPSVS